MSDAKNDSEMDEKSENQGDDVDGDLVDEEEPGSLNDKGTADTSEDPELEAIRARVREMEEAHEKLRQMQDEAERQVNSSMSSSTSVEDRQEVDSRSVHVGNVDYSATADDLERHFHGCGSINRVTILCDKFNHNPKGFAYIEFADKDSAQMALALDESLFKGRQIKVSAKRTNTPGISTTNRGGVRGFYRGRRSWRGGPWFRGSRRPRRAFYSPY